MRFGWIVLLLLSFPVLEAIGIFWMADEIGGWVLLWLLADVAIGIALIRFERVAWGARLLFSVQSGTHPVAALFASGRILLAGGLLVFPGFISDALALVLLLIPGTWARRQPDPARTANDEVLEGEFRREPEDRLR
ncbi:MAG: FxsA protein [Thiobacillus sp. 65-69]|nr:FxsA family protein [Thiobacillus sp.]ODU91052.1 MAG: FxsA protein [Thiobacillus sp. SCN 65-179]OJW37954.1 MAG: FxsA protein [Thiobacillus sp. 65-69]